jgi:alanine racemase
MDTGALEHNYRLLKAALKTSETSEDTVELLAIVKADAYGHGLQLCAPAAVRAGARWLGVTSVEEGVAARRVCPFSEAGAEILVVSGVFPDQGAAVIQHRLTPVVWQTWHLDELEAAAHKAKQEPRSVPVHLELESGMNRQGASEMELERMAARLRSSSALRLDGILTHLYAADESGGDATREQFRRLRAMLERTPKSSLEGLWLHVGNSAAVLSGEALRALRALGAEFGMRPMARPGLALYGLTPAFAPDEPATVTALRGKLRPVLTWKTRVVGVHQIEPGQSVGYNGTFVATKPMRVALLAVGYADGLKRALSNRGSVLLRGQRCPIVGRISMDQTVVDVTGVPEAATGDEVVLLGAQGRERIAAEEHAHIAGTIVWEILTSIGARAERLPVGNPAVQGHYLI